MNPSATIPNELRTISEDMEIDINEVEELREIGRGTFGVVYRGVWKSKVVAVKKINTVAEQKTFMVEVRQLSRVSHPNIIRLYGASTKRPVCLIMELAEASLYEVLDCRSRISYTHHHAINWALQCARGVAYLHGMKPSAIIHRDLKPPNLLLMMEGRVLKICDFGTACDMRTQMTNGQGSAAWMAPEVFEGSHYTEKCDVFSWSIILWESLARRKPFWQISDTAFTIMWAIHTGKRPPLIIGCPFPLENLMTSCWHKDPNERPSMEQIVKEMSHLFQFFPDEIPPLEYPNPIDSTDDSVSATTGVENDCSELSVTNSSDSSAVLTSLPIPRIKHHLSPAHHDTRTQHEGPDNLLPSFNQMLNHKENMLQPGRSLISPITLSPRVMECSGPSEPLHLIIGGESEESAEGYAISPLGEDFLLGNQGRLPSCEAHTESLHPRSLETPRRPQQFQYPFKRRSAEFPPVFLPTPPSIPAPTHPRQAELSGWSESPSSREAGVGTTLGHRRSSSYGNSPQLWNGITQQQSMPCISNLHVQPQSPRHFGETSHGIGEQHADEFLFLLHPSVRPIPPCPTSQVSMRVYEEHMKMAKEFLAVQKNLQWMTKYCDELFEHLEKTKKKKQNETESHWCTSQQQQPLEQVDLQRAIDEFVRLENEKESLLKFHRSLKEQLSKIRQEHSQEQQTHQPPDQSRSSPLPDDGWVVLSRI